MSTYRTALIGCGQVSRDHLIGWSRCTGARVVAACDPDLERARGRGAEFGFDAVYENAEVMLAKEQPDLVDVVTPRETHAKMVRLAVRHGVRGVLCEKPLCPTLAEAQSLVREIGTARVMVNENWRYRAYFRRVGQWIAEGRLGTLVHYRQSLWRSNYLPGADGRLPGLVRQPFTAHEPRLLVAETLIHVLDVARSLLGDLDVVAARIANAAPALVGEDTAVVLMETPAGLSAHVEGVMTAAGHGPREGTELAIAGTRCSGHFRDGRLWLTGAEQEEHFYDEDEQRQACFDASIQHFVDAMTSGAPFWTSAEDQLGTLKIVEQAYALAGPLRYRRPAGGATA